MLHSKFNEDLGKANDVIKQVDFDSSTIKKHKQLGSSNAPSTSKHNTS